MSLSKKSGNFFGTSFKVENPGLGRNMFLVSRPAFESLNLGEASNYYQRPAAGATGTAG
jgi:hypothetical protein